MPGRLKAILLLTWAVLRTAFIRLLGVGRAGIAAFRENYDADRLPPVSEAERAAMSGFGRCIACGVCDRGEAERIARSAGAYRGVMAIVLAGGRSMPDFHAAAKSLGFVPESVIRSKEVDCPADVPILQITRFIREKAAEVGYSVPPPAVSEKRPSDQARLVVDTGPAS
ncbi:MAG: hypothetical protein KF718_18220 [Polyangiaceae bacterium]|nr:hypothetical protein [Polyangiaceae bacterium]